MTKHNGSYRNGLPPLEPYDPYRASVHYKTLPSEAEQVTKSDNRDALKFSLEIFFCVFAVALLLYGFQTS